MMQTKQSSQSSADTILIVAALHRELQPTANRLKLTESGKVFTGAAGSHRIAAATIGVGAGPAESAMNHLIRSYQPKQVVSIGFAGGLDPAMRGGEVMHVRWITDPQGDFYALGETIAKVTDKSNRMREQTVITTNHVVATVEEKRELFERHRAAAVDMESMTIARIAQQMGMKLTVLRAISDTADQAMPAESVKWIKPDGSVDTAAAAGYFVTHPWKLPMFMQLRSATVRGANQLAERVWALLTGPA